MGQAEDLFNEVFFRAMAQFGTVDAFRDFFERGLPMAQEETMRENAALLQRVVNDPTYQGIFIKPPKEPSLSFVEMIRRMSKTLLGNAQARLNAASLVFAHSALDAWVLDLCRVTAMKAPRDWESSVKDKQIALLSVRQSTYESLLDEALRGFFQQLEKESLLKKVDLLFQRCRPEPEWRGQTYRYDRDRLMRLDTLRHEIIHGDALSGDIPDLRVELLYLRETGMHLMRIVSLRYKVQLDPSYALRGEAPA